MNVTTNINLNDISNLTQQRYGFSVINYWDKYRWVSDEACVTGVCTFEEDKTGYSRLDDTIEFPQTLEGKSIDEIAEIFMRYFQKIHFNEIENEKYETQNLCIKPTVDNTIPCRPTIYAIGEPIHIQKVNNTNIKINQISNLTQSRYDFPVWDWDSSMDSNGGFIDDRCFLGRYSFEDITRYSLNEDVNEFPQTLEGKSNDEIAEIFMKIFQKFQFREIANEKYEATNLCMRVINDDAKPLRPTIPFRPTITVMGKRIKPQK